MTTTGDAPLLRWMIGRVLRAARLRQGRTLRDVAAAAGVSLPYLSEVERGRKEASSEILASICRALGLSLADLLAEVHAELLRGRPRAIASARRDLRSGRPEGETRLATGPAAQLRLVAGQPRPRPSTGEVRLRLAGGLRPRPSAQGRSARRRMERIAFHSGRTIEEIERDFDRDRWFTAEQARDYGLVDAVISDPAQVAR
jgi:transcriptional regulator with XRE-family HTH domain